MLDQEALIQSFIRRSMALAPDRLSNYLSDGQGNRYDRRPPYAALAARTETFLSGDLSDRFALVSGLRGTGKTTMVAQVYNALLTKGVPQSRLLYLSMDEVRGMLGCGLSEVMQGYERSLGKNLESFTSGDRAFLLVDEVHYDPAWPLTLKSLYDRTRNLFILATGSSAVSLNMSTDLARRAGTVRVFPMSFGEFNHMRYGMALPATVGSIYDILLCSRDAAEAHRRLVEVSAGTLDYLSRIKPMQLNEYLRVGSMPFALPFKEEQAVHDRALAMLEKVVFQDLEAVGKFDRSTQLKIMNLMTYLATADKLDYAKMTSVLEISKTTLTAIFEALEKADLVYKIWPRGSASSRIRKTPKYKIMAPAIRTAILTRVGAWTDTNGTYGKLLEDTVALTLHRHVVNGKASDLEYDPGDNCADFILTLNDRSRLVIEVGYGAKGIEQVVNTSRHVHPKFGIVISDTELDHRDNVLMMPKDLFLLP